MSIWINRPARRKYAFLRTYPERGNDEEGKMYRITQKRPKSTKINDNQEFYRGQSVEIKQRKFDSCQDGEKLVGI